MDVRFDWIRLTKRYPLRIARGISTGSDNLFVTVSDGEFEGVGEGAPGVGTDDVLLAADVERLREIATPELLAQGPQRVATVLAESGIDPSVTAALEIALWDLLGKRAGLPLFRVFGLRPPTVPTSVTIGINPVEVVRERVPEILARGGAKALKVKLGSPEGPEHDRESFEAARTAAGPGVGIRVDANGGWSPSTARVMLSWLAERGCETVEQPLARGEEGALPEVFEGRPLPIFLDESCRTSRDVPALASRCDGVNVKLMKTGGLTEAIRLVATARAHGLSTMIGCMGESSVAIAAGASIGALFDQIDLDSHLNLAPDPADGVDWRDGVVTPREVPGHGARLIAGP